MFGDDYRNLLCKHIWVRNGYKSYLFEIGKVLKCRLVKVFVNFTSLHGMQKVTGSTPVTSTFF